MYIPAWAVVVLLGVGRSRPADLRTHGLAPEIFYSWNALFFADTLCTCNNYQRCDAICTSGAGGNNTVATMAKKTAVNRKVDR